MDYADWCKHYDRNVALGDGVCGAGINVASEHLGGDITGMLVRMPCRLSNGASCAKREVFTQAEAEALEAKEERAINEVFKALALIREVGTRSGWVVCPRCNSALHFARSLRNGHLHAACETDGCIRFME
jgi:hypothetical protein